VHHVGIFSMVNICMSEPE